MAGSMQGGADQAKQNQGCPRLYKVRSEGDRLEHLEEVYRESFARFVRVARAITGDEESASDAVQEAFARAVRARHELRDSSAARAWVARIVLNCAHDVIRTRPDLGEGIAVESAFDEPAGSDAQMLRRLVAQLPERQRHALFLRYYADFDYSAIAETLGIEVGTVSATLHAAHTGVARLLEEVGS